MVRFLLVFEAHLVITAGLDRAEYSYRRSWSLGPITARYSVGITALVGPNGAGKTTLLRLMAAVTRPRTGVLTIDGRPVTGWRGRDRYRSRIGYLPQSPAWPGGWRVVDYVEYVAAMYRVSDPTRSARQALRQSNASDLCLSRMGELSGGQRQRVFLAGTLAHEPDVLILDEPTVGLDPAERISFRRHLMTISLKRCVLLSTHLMDDVVQAAQQVHVINKGQVRWEGTVAQLEQRGRAVACEPGVNAAENGYLALLQSTAR